MIKVLQLTDMHLFENNEAKLLGENTDSSFKAVLDLALTETPPPDCYLLTGDLSQDHKEITYKRLANILTVLKKPIYYIPGNHDHPELLNKNLTGGFLNPSKSISLGVWQIILLDSVLFGHVEGFISNAQLQFLDQELLKAKDKHVLVCLHHHPIDTGSTWVDQVGLTNQEELWKIMSKHKNIASILFGHIHQDFERNYNNIKIFSSPSTSIQFAPGTDKFAIDPIAPGYRTLSLYPDGRVETKIKRVENYKISVNLNAKGY